MDQIQLNSESQAELETPSSLLSSPSKAPGFRVKPVFGLPPSAYYIPSFITPALEASLLAHINSAPRPKWITLSHRRLQTYPSPLSAKSNTLLDESMPPWLEEVARMIKIVMLEMPGGEEKPVFEGSPHGRANHCLVNEYVPGQGIAMHEDGDAYFGVVATVTLGSYGVLDITPKGVGTPANATAGEVEGVTDSSERWRVLQERCSLLIMTGVVYRECLHGIKEVSEDEGLDRCVNWEQLAEKEGFPGGKGERGTRISLTFRDVKKVKKLGGAFGALGRRPGG